MTTQYFDIKIQKQSGEGAQPTPQTREEVQPTALQTPSQRPPHLTSLGAFGASILAPLSLDLCPPPKLKFWLRP